LNGRPNTGGSGTERGMHPKGDFLPSPTGETPKGGEKNGFGRGLKAGDLGIDKVKSRR